MDIPTNTQNPRRAAQLDLQIKAILAAVEYVEDEFNVRLLLSRGAVTYLKTEQEAA